MVKQKQGEMRSFLQEDTSPELYPSSAASKDKLPGSQ